MNKEILNSVEYKQCPLCRKRKKGKKSDCGIYQAVFYRRSENAMDNLDKFFDEIGCKYYDERGQ